MHLKVALVGVLSLALITAAYGQYDPRKGPPLLIKPGQLQKLAWKPSPPHPDVVMCCGGALQLYWSPMDGGVVSSVALNIDATCPNELQNQQFVKYLFQAASKGIVTLDFRQNGDYYISCSVGEHCSRQGMQFLLAVRGCPADNPTYTPVIPINVNCQALQQQQQQAAAAAGGLMAGRNETMGMQQAAGVAMQQNPAAERQASSSSSSSGVGTWLTLIGAAVAAAAAIAA